LSHIPLIVTHVNPDWDALASSWLLLRFHPGLANAKLAFVSAKEPNEDLLRAATAVVDVGLRHDTATLRFDHHQENSDPKLSATGLVFKHLKESGIAKIHSHALAHLEPLVGLINDVDVGRRWPEAEFSFSLGIHGLLSAERFRLSTAVPKEHLFTEVSQWAFATLDLLCNKLSFEMSQQEELQRRMIYSSADKRFCAARSVGAMAAFEAGAHIALIQASPTHLPTGVVTFPITLSRAPGVAAPDIGDVITSILEDKTVHLSDEIREELKRWWQHPAGFYAGRGTSKAPCPDPISINLEELAKIIDNAWKR
jgi:hypothetical protein